MERRKTPSLQGIAKEEESTVNLSLEKVAALLLATPSCSVSAHVARGGVAAVPAPHFPSVRLTGCSHVLISCNHMDPVGSLSPLLPDWPDILTQNSSQH